LSGCVWEGTPEDQNKDEPPQVPKIKRTAKHEIIEASVPPLIGFGNGEPPNQKLQQTKSLALAHLVINGRAGEKVDLV
jgi:hypothetical protein